jgi:hypothetical protein
MREVGWGKKSSCPVVLYELILPQDMKALPSTGRGDITENVAGLQPYVNKRRRHE